MVDQSEIANFSLADIKVYLCALLTIIPIVLKVLDKPHNGGDDKKIIE